MTSATDFLMGSGSGSARFDSIGDTITGQIVSTEVRQQTAIADGKPLTWDDGTPRMQLVITLQTDAKDDGDDDGRRNLYVKGSTKAGSKSLHDAVRAAVQSVGAKGLEPGGSLTVTFIGEEPAQTRGFSPRKLYEASYSPPDQAAASGSFLGTAPAEQPAPVTTPAPAPAPAAKPANVAETAKMLIGAGMEDAEIASATGLDAAVVALLRKSAA